MESRHTNEGVVPNAPNNVLEITKNVLFIVGSAVIGMIAFRNSVQQYIEKFWGASHDFWGALWKTIFSKFGNDDCLVYFIGTPIVSLVAFATFNMLFLCCDVTGRPSWLLKYKIQDKNMPVDRKKLWKALKTVAFNLMIINPLFTSICYPIGKYIGAYHTGELPTFEWFIVEIIVFSLIEELFFYYSHRLLHTPAFYAKYHKKHHEWQAPIGITSVYCGTLEMVMSNLLPLSLGPLFMRSHVFTSWIWISIVLFSTTLAHGGYHVPYLFSPEAHDYHHKVYNCWYGTLGILDKIHKTDRPFKGSVEEKRHFISVSLTPVREQIPDPPKKHRVSSPAPGPSSSTCW